jgi:hypothetical protein
LLKYLPSFYQHPENLKAIARIREIWADEKSLATCDYLLRLRQSFDDEAAIAAEPDEYLHVGVPSLLLEPLGYIDAGPTMAAS